MRPLRLLRDSFEDDPALDTAVSRALMLRPRLLLLDEPSLGLAPLIVREIFRILRTINR